MTLWSAADLAGATGGQLTAPFDVTGISIDTRTLQPGDLFVALHGDRDGHAHLAEAFRRGAAGAMVHGPAEGGPLLRVDDTLAGLQALGRAGRDRFRGRVVAITGSVGKTTTKEMLRTALAPFGPTHAAVASYNNHWGVPLTLARLPADAAFCVAEIGMNHAGEILPLAQMARPHVAVITAIASSHIGHLGSLEAIADEKASILRGLVPGGVAVLPAETPFLDRLRAVAPGPVRLFGAGERRGGVVTATIDGTPVAFALPAPGAHMASNALAALTACAALGLDLARAASALESFTPVQGRGLQQALADGVTLLDESYNASAASVRAALKVLQEQPGRRIAVLGDMLELGPFGVSEHENLAPDVTEAAHLLYACGPLMRHLYDAVPPRLQGAHAADSAALAPLLRDALRPGDTVLVKGSLGSRMAVVVQALGGHRSGGKG